VRCFEGAGRTDALFETRVREARASSETTTHERQSVRWRRQ
jgi:hypothetical protein